MVLPVDNLCYLRQLSFQSSDRILLMRQHIFLPTLDIEQITLLPEHETWLRTWLQEIEPDIERGDVAASMCLQGVISELLLNRHVLTDWVGIMDEYLTYQGKP